MKLVDAPVISNEEVCPGVHLMRLRAPDIAAEARPGQYVMVHCGEGPDLVLRRPLSIHRASADGSVDFLLAAVGRGTDWLAQRRGGDVLDLLGPLGNGFSVNPGSRSLLLVAGGIGIAPLAALAEEAIAANRSVRLLIGCGTASQVYPERLLPPGIETIVATEDCSLGEGGMVTDLLPRFVPDADQLFACGPLPMYRAMREMSSLFGGVPVQVTLETVLGCGVGACLGCSIETVNGRKLVCKDGPVFQLGEVIWDKMAAPPAGRRH
jgi:dihydroorotate dehydrogenase electron transfer subunit